MAKKVSFGARPAAKSVDRTKVDGWVEARQSAGAERMKRLTIDVSATLHARIKSQCALKGVKMNDAIRELLEKYFPPGA
jgi:predicted DNA binding CopG/RHH family protein